MENLGHFLECTLFLFLVAAVVAIFVLGIRIAVRDAKRRGKSPLLVCIACVLFFPWGLVAWVLFRPDPIDKGKDGFRLKNFRVQ